MLRASFRDWLRGGGVSKGAVSTIMSRCRRIEKAFCVDLDEEFRRDRGERVLKTLQYSHADWRAGRNAPPELRIAEGAHAARIVSRLRSATKEYFRFFSHALDALYWILETYSQEKADYEPADDEPDIDPITYAFREAKDYRLRLHDTAYWDFEMHGALTDLGSASNGGAGDAYEIDCDDMAKLKINQIQALEAISLEDFRKYAKWKNVTL